MRRRFWLAICLILLGGCARNPPLSETPLQFSIQGEAEISLPPGDLVYQDGDRVLFLSSYTLDRPPTTVVAFSLKEQREEWRLDLPAAPVQALRFGSSCYLIATAPAESSHEAYVGAVDLQGDLVWLRPWGGTMTALSSDGERVWVAWEGGVTQIDPETGESQRSVATWERASGYGEHRVVAAYTEDRTYLIAAAGRMVFLYREDRAGDWEPVWSFRSAGRVLELHPLTMSEAPEWLVLAHSYAYGIGPNGEVLWRTDNSDYNLDGQPVRCAEENLWAFRNVMRGVYLVNDEGVVRSWKLPGGHAHAGPLPLPFPEHLALGLRAADVDEDGEDELFVRSADDLFAFDCQANLLAYVPVDSSNEKVVAQLRRSRLHRPAIWGREIVTPGQEEMVYLTLESR